MSAIVSHRWAIVLGKLMLFSTDDRSIAVRFQAMGFDLFDHDLAGYVSLPIRKTDARDLMTEEDYLDHGPTPP